MAVAHRVGLPRANGSSAIPAKDGAQGKASPKLTHLVGTPGSGIHHQHGAYQKSAPLSGRIKPTREINGEARPEASQSTASERWRPAISPDFGKTRSFRRGGVSSKGTHACLCGFHPHDVRGQLLVFLSSLLCHVSAALRSHERVRTNVFARTCSQCPHACGVHCRPRWKLR